MDKIRILIVDDHEIIYRGIKDLLQNEVEYKIEDYAVNGKEAIVKARQIIPDIIFMDISMPEMNGIEAIKVLSAELSDSKLIVLTQHDEGEIIFQAMRAGAHGYLLKNSTKEQFIFAMQQVLSGKRYLNDETSRKMIDLTLNKFEQERSENEIYLTRREKEIIRKIYEDKSNHQIAEDLNISLRTVETHRRNIMQKLKVTTVIGLLKIAAKLNLITLK